MKFKQLIYLYAPPVLLMILIYYLSLQSSFPVVNDQNLSYWTDFVLKKIAHMFVYGLLMFFWFRALNDKLSVKEALILALVIVVIYAVSDELHQTFVPEREGTIRDVLIDSVSALIVGWSIFSKQKNASI
ncbi:MAG: hypothetical protein COU81_03700 [Candidatus Portnoybacteria bacterium CG10_big_fil_rev_8_21_14_0_10_36_7]|uniref:VanZ-like domain-containing protein n=1 Tax=Candidatus Portnoybacteria bacterium CG10_big_fil_rev_8_21_14_0_10_36_7 TaxID=1974812 RepID=A0A2M8KD66_9BACT|nr:MAG: hypothetical protein COU81_03700 [Candidatus Portnoybacteria bacterium CG10_big_fil_rev_8_21_14_0_10_36_7]